MPEHQQIQQSKKPESSPQRRSTLIIQNPVSSPVAIIQRTRINPKSLTPADVLQLQHTIGNRAVGKLLSEIRNPSNIKQAPIQKQEIPEEEIGPSCMQKQEISEKEETLQGKMIGTFQSQEIPEEEEPLQTKSENNTGMPDNLKVGVESLSGIDMSDVRVYYNSSKPAEVGALAYTQGTNIHIAPGQERHLPHEAWHVVQQAQGRVRPTLQMKDGIPVNNDKGLEHEADMMGNKAISQRHYIQQFQENDHLVHLENEDVNISHTSAVTILQFKGTHFWQYLNSNVPGLNAGQHVDKNMLVAAWLLDQNIYELEVMMSGDATPDLENLQKLNVAGLSILDVSSFLNQLGAPDSSRSREERISFLSSFIASIPRMLTTEISNRKQNIAGKQASVIEWKGLTSWGAGIGMELHMLPGGLPIGSGPSSDPVWMKTLEQHHPRTNDTTMYVRGHLLNDNIGGPGLDYNMVPLTGKSATNVRANDANAEHLHTIETEAKDTWSRVKNGNLLEAWYAVIAEYKRGPRPESAYVRMQEQKLLQILNGEVKSISEYFQKQTPADLQKELISAGNITLPHGMNLSTQYMAEMLARKKSRDLESMTLGYLESINSPLVPIINAQVDPGVLNASTEGKAKSTTLSDLLYCVRGNAEVWEAEDQYIPTRLHVSLRTIAKDNTAKDNIPKPVPITLSSDVFNVYYRPMKKGEFA